ncbi:hypothetical protein C7974DRAFT_328604 [Boeremia exigua]|uniref:uncharacterized protein n=1 Tax=Boeremia exigua TaxID=749465 RepID=UPI001E8CC0A9|nr:uncharacterized protein C7974DRAFT_328604 [Boeremia exigua]KAH6642900.1 hypothetical protein C7974DRAFT_328604 [Boeremia exigua]
MFKKLKEKVKGDDHKSQQQSSGERPQQQLQSNNPYFSSQQHNAAPTEKYQAPPGPPPSYSSPKSEYQAPPGPPPGKSSTSGYAPPPGPPPSQQAPPSYEAPIQHNWQIIPDTALLPPPPSLGYDDSPTANSTAEEGDSAYAWCQAHPLWSPYAIAPSTHTAIRNAQLALLKPPSLAGTLAPQPQAGHWRVRTQPFCRDSCVLTNLPLYAALADSPLRTHRPATLYYEIRVRSAGHGGSSLAEADAGIAVGFVAPPYPTFRLPGWQRGSLGVHGDDGRRYVNDTWGGVDFTTAFAPGETLGIGMVFRVPSQPPGYGAGQGRGLDVEVFFTRNGKKEGGWDGNEELDARSEGGTLGLGGDFDLFPAIGVFGGVDFEVFFHHSQWLYQPF